MPLKISALPASTTPLAGTEVLPIVQSSTTRQVSVANLTAGRAISATQLTLTTGNLIVASGQGIDFSATSGTGTSELFDDYEIGDWTPALSDGTTSVNGTVGRYVKIGNVVICGINIYYANLLTLGAGQLRISGFPFANNGTYSSNNSLIASLSAASPVLATISGSNSHALLFKIPGAVGDPSSLTKADFVLSTAASCWGTFIYYTA